jgi:predicted lipoprotein with Yx(FWY)xxD motif
MRTSYLVLNAILALLAGSAIAEETGIERMPYPGAVALLQDRTGVWSYKSFPTFLPLYIFDGEPSGISTCDRVCSEVWPIVKAEDDAKPLGNWTIVQRADGRMQWAFKNKPVYTYFEDLPNDPNGVGKDQDWYLGEGGVAYLIRAGVKFPSDYTLTGHEQASGTHATARLLQP